MTAVFAVGTTVSLAGPPGKRQVLRAGQRLEEGLPLMGKLLTNPSGPEPQYRADAYSVSCWLDQWNYFHKCWNQEQRVRQWPVSDSNA